jgi:hypothetical protein
MQGWPCSLKLTQLVDEAWAWPMISSLFKMSMASATDGDIPSWVLACSYISKAISAATLAAASTT